MFNGCHFRIAVNIGLASIVRLAIPCPVRTKINPRPITTVLIGKRHASHKIIVRSKIATKNVPAIPTSK